MSRSFQVVEDKIEETEFFLNLLNPENNGYEQFNYRSIYFLLSAFLSASRSITFCLQASMKNVEEFSDWYEKQQDKLRSNKLAKFFYQARNLSQKVGYYPIGGGSFFTEKDGKRHIKFYFDSFNVEGLDYIPSTDVVTACTAYFESLLTIMIDCYNTFGRFIDPEKYFSYENMILEQKNIEDFEEELGFPKGWTEAEGVTTKERIKLLRDSEPKIQIDWIFKQHFGTDRYGNRIQNKTNDSQKS